MESKKDEVIFYIATVVLSCFMGAIIGELYDTHEENDSINIKRVVIGGTTSSVVFAGIGDIKALTFNKILALGFFLGLFGIKILEKAKSIEGPRMAYIFFNEGIKSCVDYIMKDGYKSKAKDEENKESDNKNEDSVKD